MKLTKIHRLLKFKQSDWMKKYIDFNTEKRMNATNDFEKDFVKLMINSVYGKTMENLQKIISVRLGNKAEEFLKYTSKPTYITHNIFGKDYAAIYDIKSVLILNKPIYVGFTVLDLSKWKTYDFHYNLNKKNFDAELMFTDADSLTYEIKSENVYEEFFKWKNLLDFSNYSKDSKTNKKVIGEMKYVGGVVVIEFAELKSKMYSVKKMDGKECNTAKGVSIATEFDKFKDVLFIEKIVRHKMKTIQCKDMKLYMKLTKYLCHVLTIKDMC